MNHLPLRESVETVWSSIQKDVRRGAIPASVRSFEELHDYVDANEYLQEIFDGFDLERDATFANVVMSFIDQRFQMNWLRV